MTNRMPGFEQQNKDVDPITTGMFYVRPVTPGMNIATETQATVATNTNVDTSGKNGGSSEHQTENQPTSKANNNGLTKALVGGLIGATLGTLAAALANKRTSQGLNHAAKGIGQATKTVGEGVNHAAQGVGQAVKSVTEGVNYVVVGGVAEAVKNTAQTAQQAVESATEAVQDSVHSNEVVESTDRINSTDKIPVAYVLIPVQQDQVIAQTNTVEPQMFTADQVNSSLYEPEIELNQDMESSESFFQANESTSSEEFSGTSEQYD